MLITHLLDDPCPKCGEKGRYGNVNVTNNILKRGCNNCNSWISFPLPGLQKKIIYLDQFFFSHAFRAHEKPFVDAANRIKDMAARQLLVCPFSSIHTDETHLWRHKQRDNLYQFIKQTARGQKYNLAFQIKKTQIRKAFSAFVAQAEISNYVEESDAFLKDIHRWDDYIYIDIGPILGDLEVKRVGKTQSIAGLVNLFPKWAELTTSFDTDVQIETICYARSLIDQYFQMVEDVGSGNWKGYLERKEGAAYIESLLRRDDMTMGIDQRLNRIADFLSSIYFSTIPHIRISCELMAVLRKLVKNGAYRSPSKAQRLLAGLFYDMECISVFGPYSHAVFVDRSMMNWFEDTEAKLLGTYGTRVFSVANWDSFNRYLDQIEENYTDEIREAINWVYPSASPAT